MQSRFQSIHTVSTVSGFSVESDAVMISEGLFAIALPLGFCVAILMKRNRKRRIFQRQIKLLERIWEKSNNKVQ